VPEGTNRRQGDDDLVDLRFARHEWVVRNWRSGERFWPAHTKEPKKIKELLQDRHITGEKKQRWPVIACGDEIIWLSGFGVRRDLLAKDGFGVLIREIQGSNR
jgi:tRNA(Ile)-lysidine synthetase-like protein